MIVAYPYSEEMTYSEGRLTMSVPEKQHQTEAGNSAHIGRNSAAVAKTVVPASGNPAEFTLSHMTALVRMRQGHTDILYDA